MDKVNMCQIQKQIDNSKEEMMGVISFILAIFPLSFVINSYLVAMKNIGENQGTENIRTVFFYVLIFLIIGLMFIIMYILTSAIKIKAHRYSLLFILGIKKKDFWKILYKDYCITLLLIGVKSTIVVNTDIFEAYLEQYRIPGDYEGMAKKFTPDLVELYR